MDRKATAVWNGSGKEGKGTLSTQSKTLNNTAYSYHSRFEQGAGTNPEELIAAAHSGCFCMKLAFVLGEAGYAPEKLETTATVTLDGGKVTKSHLVLKANVPGISKEKFQECADNAKANCPISMLLNADITLDASLEGAA